MTGWSHARRATAGWGVVALVVVVALIRAMSARTHPPRNHLSEAERRMVGAMAAASEPTWREESRRDFPGDAWSQDDDFGARERKWTIDEARRREVPISDVLRAIDEELRASAPVAPPREASAAPCKPRPFYD